MNSFIEELQNWRTSQNLSLTGERGWLRLSALFWIDEDMNVTLTDICARMTGPLGYFSLKDDRLIFTPASQVTLNGKLLTGKVELIFPEEDSDQIFKTGPLEFILIRREGRLALRVWDSQSQEADDFNGRSWFTADENWIIRGESRHLNESVSLVIPNALGGTDTVSSHGAFSFSLDGTQRDLYAVNQGDDRMFIIFTDTHDSTYPAGRYVTALKDKEGWYIDFNRAFNPPCAATPFATCPYAPAQNRLDFPIPAGERYGKD